jgi:hypothetical protein
MKRIIIEESIRKLELLKKSEELKISEEFKDVPPVCWFGNIDAKKPTVVVISANPSKPEEPRSNPRIPCAKQWPDIKSIDNLIRDYNNYFQHENCATRWFGEDPCNVRTPNSQGRIEDFLNGLDASFYENKTYNAIHIDLLPFSTKTSFVNISDKIMQIDGMPEWINEHIHKLINLIKPKLIIINGTTNFGYFNLCVNMGAQPYSFININGTKVWKSSSSCRIPIIGISMNMGSRCLKTHKYLNNLGSEVSKLISI